MWTEERQKQQQKLQHLTETLNGADQLLLSKKRLFFEQSFWNSWMVLSGWANLPELPRLHIGQPLPETASLEDYLALPVFHYQQMFEEEKRDIQIPSLKRNSLCLKENLNQQKHMKPKKPKEQKKPAFRLVKQSHGEKNAVNWLFMLRKAILPRLL